MSSICMMINSPAVCHEIEMLKIGVDGWLVRKCSQQSLVTYATRTEDNCFRFLVNFGFSFEFCIQCQYKTRDNSVSVPYSSTHHIGSSKKFILPTHPVTPYFLNNGIAFCFYCVPSQRTARLAASKINPTMVQKETYNSGDSPVVTHLTTDPPVSGLYMPDQTGWLILLILWSYVEVRLTKWCQEGEQEQPLDYDRKK
ncbi:hypothetical protein EJ02DRAFT_16461 [Clathrospora elynae]|uniref:Uncharacterized protein n=1 Tax=Clathrospora elynae TaxID=706981 RepID=A0A6A5SJL9_9PLEO|nr:hypothetical protein EJ02DRAFT_16461 [Clathrospora elynae]